MIFSRHLLLVCALVMSGCASVRESVPPTKPAANTQASITVSEALPAPDYLPEQSAIAAGTKYVVIQSEGGSIFLGPILGSMNIAAKTRAMADRYKNSVFGVDPTPVAAGAVAKAGVVTSSSMPAYVVKPFVFVQHCDDDKFRLSLVFHVESTTGSAPWIGRYTYDLPTAYSTSRFGALAPEDVAQYRTELDQGAAALADLMQKDLTGNLPATGKSVKFGSLYIIGNKIGGLGIYTKPEKLYFPSAQLIEETDAYVTVRLNGNMHATGAVGGLAFGVRRSDKDLVHTLSPNN